jgi:flavodoxin
MASTSTQQPRRALVVYGSETGNAQDVAEELGRLAVRLRFETQVAELDAVTLVCQTSDCFSAQRG